MNTSTITLSSPQLSSNEMYVLTASPIKGRTQVILDLVGFDETVYPVNDLYISWGDSPVSYTYKRSPVKDYRNTSIFDEMLYGKIGDSVMNTYTHTYNSLSGVDVIQYLLEVVAWYENGYKSDYSIFIDVYPESYYDTLDELDLLSTQITSLSSNNTVVNLESRSSGQTLVCVLSS